MKKSTFFSDFKQFIAKGNAVDMAVAVVIGGAFGKIVTALVNDIIMPLVGIVVGGLNVSDWKWVIKEAVLDEAGNVTTAENALLYGDFIQAVIDFLIISFCIFTVLRIFMKIKAKVEAVEAAKKAAEEAPAEEAPAAPAETTDDILKDIRTLLQNK